MMLQIDHRESHDVDIFLDDPQVLGFLDPSRHGFNFQQVEPSAYHRDGSRFLKIVFGDIGEIDFIVGMQMTDNPTILREIEGEETQLETIPEIIAKKVFHRCASIRPRDLFDIAAASDEYSDSIISALRPYQTHVGTTLVTIEKLNPHFVNGTIRSLQIREKFLPISRTAIDRAREVLRAV